MTTLAIGSKRFLFRMEVVSPKDAGQSLRQKLFPAIFIKQVDQIAAVDFGIVPLTVRLECNFADPA